MKIRSAQLGVSVNISAVGFAKQLEAALGHRAVIDAKPLPLAWAEPEG